MSLEERIDFNQWKVRMGAYKEISRQFEEPDEEHNPFELFGPKMQAIISDQNLIA